MALAAAKAAAAAQQPERLYRAAGRSRQARLGPWRSIRRPRASTTISTWRLAKRPGSGRPARLWRRRATVAAPGGRRRHPRPGAPWSTQKRQVSGTISTRTPVRRAGSCQQCLLRARRAEVVARHPRQRRATRRNLRHLGCVCSTQKEVTTTTIRTRTRQPGSSPARLQPMAVATAAAAAAAAQRPQPRGNGSRGSRQPQPFPATGATPAAAAQRQSPCSAARRGGPCSPAQRGEQGGGSASQPMWQ